MEKKARTPQIRFAGFTDAWEQRKLGDITVFYRGLTYSPLDIVAAGSGVRVLRSSNISGDQFVLHDDDVFVAESAVNIELVKEGNILITAANGSPKLVGKHAKISNLPGNTVHGGFMLIACAEDPDYLQAMMSANWYHRFLKRGVAGGNGAIGNLDKGALSTTPVSVPETTECRYIGNLFRRIDKLLTLHQRKLELLRAIKKAMLEKMFV